MDRRDTLDIRAGFWKGPFGRQPGFFLIDGPRSAEVPLLADYSGFFGKHFVRARRDIRLFVPAWVESLILEDAVLDIEEPSVEEAPPPPRGPDSPAPGVEGDRDSIARDSESIASRIKETHIPAPVTADHNQIPQPYTKRIPLSDFQRWRNTCIPIHPYRKATCRGDSRRSCIYTASITSPC